MVCHIEATEMSPMDSFPFHVTVQILRFPPPENFQTYSFSCVATQVLKMLFVRDFR
jgi:hypothetical protein